MRLLALVVLTFITATLSGCAEGEFMEWSGEGDPAQDKDANFTAQPPAPDTNTTVNTPPVASLVADVLNGTAPLIVNFTVDGSDADGDDLTWTLWVNGTQVANGTELPATVAYNFTEAGNFSVVLRLSDGDAATEASVVISMAAPTLGVEPFPGVTFEGDVLLPIGANLGAGDVNDYCKGLLLGEQGLDCVWFEITPDMWGLSFTSSSTGEETDLRFTEGCSNDDANVQSFLTVGNEAGTVPEGAACLIVGEWIVPMSTVTVTIEPA